MNGLLLAAVAWMHLLSAVVWIGGVFFILFVALPVAKKSLEQPSKIMGPMSKRFVPLANISIFLIISSGIIMSIAAQDFTGPAGLSSLRSQSLIVKILLVIIMTIIHFCRGLILTPRIALLTSEGNDPKMVQMLQSLSLNLVKINLFMGVTVLFLTGMMYAYRA